MFRSIARVVIPAGMISVSILASVANAQIVMPNPIAAPNPLTETLSIFRSNCRSPSTAIGRPKTSAHSRRY
jgi:hypothetical protein